MVTPLSLLEKTVPYGPFAVRDHSFKGKTPFPALNLFCDIRTRTI